MSWISESWDGEGFKNNFLRSVVIWVFFSRTCDASLSIFPWIFNSPYADTAKSDPTKNKPNNIGKSCLTLMRIGGVWSRSSIAWKKMRWAWKLRKRKHSKAKQMVERFWSFLNMFNEKNKKSRRLENCHKRPLKAYFNHITPCYYFSLNISMEKIEIFLRNQNEWHC